jgi:hypothetical protein
MTMPVKGLSSLPGEPCKLITAVVPDDGSDLTLMRALRDEKGIIRANSISCYGSSILAEARSRRGKLPVPKLVRIVEVLVAETEAEEVFGFVCNKANIGRPGGGIVLQAPVPFATPYEMPEGVPDEAR